MRTEVNSHHAEADELCMRPFGLVRPLWRELQATFPGAGLYHSDAWLDLLSRAYQLDLRLATIGDGASVRAGCMLARSRSPFALNYTALPLSDSCAPLAADATAGEALLQSLSRTRPGRVSYEIRGVNPPPPWRTIECFAEWELDLTRSAVVIYPKLSSNFRRNLRKAAQSRMRIERGAGPDYIERFYELYIESRSRHGVPPQPLRFFRLVREIFSSTNDFEVWLASCGGEDVAGLVLLRYRDQLHYKWGARRVKAPPGINHAIHWSVIEEFAGKVNIYNLGRCDLRNEGLVRFKEGLGGRQKLLPYAFLPKAPQQVSWEVPIGLRGSISKLWRRLPLPVTRVLGGVLYKLRVV